MSADSAARPATVALFISDLHLQAEMPRTAAAFFSFLEQHASRAPRLYLLGDIFEYWAGDDDLSPFNVRVIDALHALAQHGTEIFWIAGNRDFLAGSTFASMAGLTILPDPVVLQRPGGNLVLTHGDALCTDDTAYMQFRAQVRQKSWQDNFLAQPLDQRKAIIAGLRQGSREAQRGKAEYIMDVNQDAVSALFAATATSTMIHGHTHRPARHQFDDQGEQRLRYVLPDWDCDCAAPRGGWIALDENGALSRINVDGNRLGDRA